MRKIVHISLFLTSILLINIVVTSVSSISELIVINDITDDEMSDTGNSPSNQNLVEEEEQHGTENYLILLIEKKIEITAFSYQVCKTSLVDIEIITPPPLS